MSPCRRTIFASGVFASALLALGLWWHAARSHQETEAALTTLQSAKPALTAALKREELRIALASRTATDPASASTAGPAASPASAKPPPDMAEIVAIDPALQLLELRRQRGLMMQDFRDFFQDEGLSPVEIETFTANWILRSERTLDLRGAAYTQDAAGQATVNALVKQASADYEAAQLALLGPERAARMQTYLQTAPLRNMAVKAAAGSAALAGIPFSPEQGRRLEQAAVAAHRYETTTSAGVTSRFAVLDWQVLDEQARQILTPRQFYLFTTSELRGRQRFDEAMYRAKEVDLRAVTPAK